MEQGGSGDSLVMELIVTAREMVTGPMGHVGSILDETKTRAQGLGAQLLETARAMSGVGLALGAGSAAILAFGIHAASTFQDAMDKVHGFAGASAADMQYYQQAVLQTSTQVGVSADKMAAGLYYVISAGFKGADAMKVLTQSAMAAAASHANMETVADAVTTALNAYHMAASSAGTVTDILSKTVVEGKTQFQELGSAIARPLTVAPALGASLAQVGAVMATLTDRGYSARLAGMALTTTMRGLLAPTTMQQKAFEALGLSSNMVAEVHRKGLIPTLMEIANAARQGAPSVQELSDRLHISASAAQTLHDHLGTTSERLKAMVGNGAAVSAMLSLSSDGFKKLSTNAEGTAHALGTTDRAFAVVSEGFAFKMAQMSTALQNFGIAVASGMLGPMASIVGHIIPVITQMSLFAEAHHTLVTAVLAAGVAIGAFSLAIRGASLIFLPYVGMVQSLGPFYMSLRDRMTEHTASTVADTAANEVNMGSLEAVTVAIQQQTVMMRAWMSQMVGNEGAITAMDAELAGLAGAQRAETVATDTQTMSLRASIVAFGEWEATVIRSAASSVSSAARSAVAWVSSLGTTLTAMAAEEGGYVALGAASARAGLEMVGAAISSAAAWVASSARAVVAMALQGAATAALAVRDGLLAAATWITVAAQTALIAVQERGVIAAVAQGVAWVATTGIMTAMGLVVDGLTASFAALDVMLLANPIGLVIITVAALIAGLVLLITHVSAVRDALGQLAAALEEKLTGVFNIFKDWLSAAGDLLGHLGSALGTAMSAVTSFGGAVSSAIGPLQGLHDALGSVTSFLGGVFDATLGHAGASLDAFAHEHDKTHQTVTRNTADEIQKMKDYRVAHDETYGAMGMAEQRRAAQHHAMAQQVINDLAAMKNAEAGYAAGQRAAAFTPGGMNQPVEQLQAAMSQLPADMRAAMEPVLDDMKNKISQAHQTYLNGVQRLNENYHSAVQRAQDSFIAKYATANSAQQASLKTAFTEHISQLRSAQSQHIQSLQQAFTQHVSSLRDALSKITTPAGIWDALSKQVDDLAKNKLASLSLAILRGSGNLGALGNAAANAEAKHQRLADVTSRATDIMNLKLGNFGTVVDDVRKKLQDNLSNATAKVQLDLLHHSASLQADEASLKRAQGQMDQFTKAQNEATAAAKASSISFKDMQTAADNTSKSLIDRLAAALANGQTHVSGLASAAGAAEARSLGLANALERATVKALEHAGAWGEAMSKTQSLLQTTLANAVGRVTNEYMNHERVTAADREAIVRAQAALNNYTAAQTRAAALAAARQPQTFQQMDQSATKRASDAMDALSRAILLGHGNITKLAEAAARAEQATGRYQAAQDRAQLLVAQRMGNFSTVWDTLSKQISDRVTTATASLEGAILTHHGNLTKLTAAVVKAEAAENHITQVEEQAAIRIAKAGGDSEKALQLLTQSLDTGLNRAVAKMTIDYYAHSGSVAADAVAMQNAANKRAQLDLASTKSAIVLEQAEYQAALRAGDFAAASEKLKTMVDNNVNRALGAMTTAIYTGQGSITQFRSNLDTAVAAQMRYNRAAQQASDALAVSELRAARAANDLSTAFTMGKNVAANAYTQALQAMAEKIRQGIPVRQDEINTVARLKAAQDAYANSQRIAEAMVGLASTNLADRLAAATTLADNSLQQYANGLALAGTASALSAQALQDLQNKAVSDAMAVQAMTQATQRAKDAVDNMVLAMHTDYDSTMQAAKAKAQEALSAYETALMNGVTGQALDVLRNAAIGAAAAVQQLTDIEKGATDVINQALQEMFPDDFSTTTSSSQDLTAQQQFSDTLAEQKLADQQKQQQFTDSLAEQKLAAQQQAAATKQNTSAVNNQTSVLQAQLATAQAALVAQQQEVALLTRAVFLGRVNLGRNAVGGGDFISWMNGLGAEGRVNMGVTV